MVDRNYLLQKIKETESNIRNWYRADGESEEISNYDLQREKKYLRSLKMKLVDYSEDRVEKLMDSMIGF